MNYSKVQFISWELHTGPAHLPVQTSPTTALWLNWYPGYDNNTTDKRLDVASQCVDIDMRVKFTADAIAQALAKANPDPSVLKIFMAPEFLYRGAGGAYLHDLLNGWQGNAPAEFGLSAQDKHIKPWTGLFGGLKQLVADDKYKDWLFVFGTAISASFPTYKDTAGKYYLNWTLPATAFNTSLIQAGGAANRDNNYASQKHYMSHIDFLNDYFGYAQHVMGNVLPADSRAVIPPDLMGAAEGSALFSIANVCDTTGSPIKFGIEICLDHAQSGVNNANNFGRIRTANESVKIQLVPSGGLSLTDASIRLLPEAGPTPNSYAFNCDGLNPLTAVVSPAGCHTQLWNGSNGVAVPQANKLIEVSNGAAHDQTVVAKVTDQVSLGTALLHSSTLWVGGSGNVRVVNPLAL